MQQRLSGPAESRGSTIFEPIWDQPDGPLFKSERHGVMVFADAFPRLPLQVVVATQYGTPGHEVHFSQLPRITRRRMHEVADAVEEKIFAECEPGQRVITHTEGFGVPDHPHIVLFAGERKQGESLYSGPVLGEMAVRHTLEAISFSTIDRMELEGRLSRVAQLGAAE